MMRIVCLGVLLKILPAMVSEPDVNLLELCSARNDHCPSGYYCSTTSLRCWPCHICGIVDIAFYNIPTKCLCDGGRDGDTFLICGAFFYPGKDTRGPLIHTQDDLASDLKPHYAHYFDGKYAERNPHLCPQMTIPAVSLTTEVETSTRPPFATNNSRNTEATSSHFSTAIISCSDPGQPEHGYQVMSNNRLTITFGCDKGYTIEVETALYCLNGTWSAEKPTCKLDNLESFQTWVTQDTGLIILLAVVVGLITVFAIMVCYCCRCFKSDRSITERAEVQQGLELEDVVSDQNGTSQFDPMLQNGKEDVVSDQNGTSQFDPMLQNGNGNVIKDEIDRMMELPMTAHGQADFSDETLREVTWANMQPLLETAFEDKKFKRAFLKQWLSEASQELHSRLNHVTGTNFYQALKEEADIFGVNTYQVIGGALKDEELRRCFPYQQNNITQLINVLVEAANARSQECAKSSHEQQLDLETIV